MTFGQPEWFWALMILPVLVAMFFWNQNRARKMMDRIVARRLVSELAGSVSRKKRLTNFFLQIAGMALVIASLARPQIGNTWEQSKTKGRDVLIAVDVSKSMLAADLAPNRLTRAKLAAQDLAQALQGDRIGVIAFAGTAFLQAPLTVDYGAVVDSIRELDTDIIPRGGTNIAQAIKIAAEAFGKGESENRALVLFSDGEELDADALAAAREQAQNFRIFTVGVGSSEGAIIPLPGERGGTNFVKDEKGQFVKSRLDEERLKKLAELTGGFYLRLQNGPANMKQIVNEGLEKLKDREMDTQMSRHPIERYQWPLGAGIALIGASLLMNERKRREARAVVPRAVAVALILLAFPVCGFSKNAGIELYEKQNYSGAFDHFKKQLEKNGESELLNFDAGTAAYKTGNYDQALEAFSKALVSRDESIRAKAEYNLGNTLVQRGVGKQEKEARINEWKGALQHYDEALKVEPKNADAKYNRELIQKLIEETQKEQEQQKEQQKQDEKKDQPQEQKKDQNSPPQEKNDPKNQDKKDDKKDQQKDQSKSGDGQKPDENKPEQSSKEGEPKSPGDEKKENQSSKPNEQKSSAQNGDKGEPDEKPEKPDPENAPPPSEKKPSGEIHADSAPPDEKSEGMEADEPAHEGEMTKNQAMSLLDSAKGDEERVSLNERKRNTGVTRDW